MHEESLVVMDNNARMLPRVFHGESLSPGAEVTLTGGAAEHIGKVLRLREGDAVILFNGDGLDHSGRIISTSRQKIVVLIGTSNRPDTESPMEITLLQGVCRNQRMDLLIQKSTELGVRCIQPVTTERSITKLDRERALKKQVHWQNIAISACEQSGRAYVPAVRLPESLNRAFERIDRSGLLLMLEPGGGAFPEQAIRAAPSIVLLIGPEGGLTDTERQTAEHAGFMRARLGPRVLRTETAPLAALSIIQYLAGDLADAR